VQVLALVAPVLQPIVSVAPASPHDAQGAQMLVPTRLALSSHGSHDLRKSFRDLLRQTGLGCGQQVLHPRRRAPLVFPPGARSAVDVTAAVLVDSTRPGPQRLFMERHQPDKSSGVSGGVSHAFLRPTQMGSIERRSS
jgi:hypothetical protein